MPKVLLPFYVRVHYGMATGAMGAPCRTPAPAERQWSALLPCCILPSAPGMLVHLIAGASDAYTMVIFAASFEEVRCAVQGLSGLRGRPLRGRGAAISGPRTRAGPQSLYAQRHGTLRSIPATTAHVPCDEPRHIRDSAQRCLLFLQQVTEEQLNAQRQALAV